ncbi:MAG TPA: urea ABC transporter ATP-binding protein UrtD [Burkholderiaceae bacterium]
MTPELMDEGAAVLERARARATPAPSGGASFGRVVQRHVPDFAHGVALYLDDISVSFDGFKALDALSLAIDVGELRCIIGPNGAGKTTMMDVITGKTRPDAGRAHFGTNIDLLRLREPEIVRAGICRKFQKPTVYEELSVFENLELALDADRGVRATLTARMSAAQRERIAGILELVHLLPEARRLAGLLSHGQKQWLEIGMLLAQEPKLLLVDEPVAGMTDSETVQTAELLKEINRTKTVVVVEHDMAFVRELGVKVTCLHEGSVLAEGSIDQVSQNERVVEVYLGR